MNIGQRSMNWKKNKEHKLNNGNGKDKHNVLVVFFCVHQELPANAIQAILSVFKAFCVKDK